MAKSVAFVHHKGGTGKTTSCISIAGYLAGLGKRTLVVDLDPQGNATVGLGIDRNSLKRSMYDVITNGSSLKDVIIKTDFNNLHIAPSSYGLAGIELNSDTSLFSMLFDDVKNDYDYILIDTPPSIGRLMVAGIAAADRVITTLDPGIFALDGMQTIEKVFDSVKKEVDKDIKTDIIILTKVRRNFLARILGRDDPSTQIEKILKSKYRKKIFLIPHDENVFKSQIEGEPLYHFSPNCKASKAYVKVAETILKW